MSNAETEQETAEAYAMRRGFQLTGQLGAGLNGRVWKVRGKAKRAWAVKIQDARGHRRERAVYERLGELQVTEIHEFNIPVMLWADNAWNAVEMTIVERPFILDFAQAYLDEPPDFSEEVWAERRETWMGRYEEEWPRVEAALWELERLGIYYLDVHKNNIAV